MRFRIEGVRFRAENFWAQGFRPRAWQSRIRSSGDDVASKVSLTLNPKTLNPKTLNP